MKQKNQTETPKTKLADFARKRVDKNVLVGIDFTDPTILTKSSRPKVVRDMADKNSILLTNSSKIKKKAKGFDLMDGLGLGSLNIEEHMSAYNNTPLEAYRGSR